MAIIKLILAVVLVVFLLHLFHVFVFASLKTVLELILIVFAGLTLSKYFKWL